MATCVCPFHGSEGCIMPAGYGVGDQCIDCWRSPMCVPAPSSVLVVRDCTHGLSTCGPCRWNGGYPLELLQGGVSVAAPSPVKGGPGLDPESLTISHAQVHQPWTVPYSAGVEEARKGGTVPHVLASHNVLHAAKTLGKLAAVFEALDHSGAAELSTEQWTTVREMSADLMSEALRFANLFGFSLAQALLERIEAKNGKSLPPWPAVVAALRGEP